MLTDTVDQEDAYWCEWCAKWILEDDGLYVHDDEYHPDGYVYHTSEDTGHIVPVCHLDS